MDINVRPTVRPDIAAFVQGVALPPPEEWRVFRVKGNTPILPRGKGD